MGKVVGLKCYIFGLFLQTGWLFVIAVGSVLAFSYPENLATLWRKMSEALQVCLCTTVPVWIFSNKLQ